MLGAFTIIDRFLETEAQSLTLAILKEINYAIKNDEDIAKTNIKLMKIHYMLKVMNGKREDNYE